MSSCLPSSLICCELCFFLHFSKPFCCLSLFPIFFSLHFLTGSAWASCCGYLQNAFLTQHPPGRVCLSLSALIAPQTNLHTQHGVRASVQHCLIIQPHYFNRPQRIRALRDTGHPNLVSGRGDAGGIRGDWEEPKVFPAKQDTGCYLIKLKLKRRLIVDCIEDKYSHFTFILVSRQIRSHHRKVALQKSTNRKWKKI